MTPLVSVIIPTANRPQFLPRAVESALQAMEGVDIEVIVVPNGPDQSWRESLKQFSGNPSVRCSPIKSLNGNRARNHGMWLARGNFIRFLDDDDELSPSAGIAQCSSLESTGADVSSGAIQLVDKRANIFGRWSPDDATTDFTASACSPRRALQMTALLFRKSAVNSHPWDDTLLFGQDICWVLDIVAKRDLAWIKIPDDVGKWRRHIGSRVSTNSPIHSRRKLISERLIHVAHSLDARGVLNDERRKAIASGIWEQIHEAFCFSPAYWWSVGKWALKFCPEARPPVPLYDTTRDYRRMLNPLYVELAAAPRRMFRHAWRRVQREFGLVDWW